MEASSEMLRSVFLVTFVKGWFYVHVPQVWSYLVFNNLQRRKKKNITFFITIYKNGNINMVCLQQGDYER